ncbi:MAG: hypothetical protein INQ03_21350 [Candidatus Heimdallarchaeota archaeon]|nr:hypothetical protein [Candidatus Heimdallarchaeota archaeon]
MFLRLNNQSINTCMLKTKLLRITIALLPFLLGIIISGTACGAGTDKILGC